MPLLTATDKESGSRLRRQLRNGFVRGIVLTVPLLLTLVILGFVTNFIFSRLNPLVGVVESLFGLPNIPTYLVQVGVFLGVILLILLIGIASLEWQQFGRIEHAFDDLMTSIPGVGPIYSSFNEMSELLLDSQNQSFKDVKLVEYPTQGSYSIAFVTADTPDYIEDAVGDGEMTTLYMPMAPNPVMGGFVLSVEQERIIDVEMSVQQGIQSIVTSGVALGTKSKVPEDSEKLADFQVNHDVQPPVAGRAEQFDSSADVPAETEDESTTDTSDS